MIHLKPLQCRDILPNFTFETLALQVPGGHFLIFSIRTLMLCRATNTRLHTWCHGYNRDPFVAIVFRKADLNRFSGNTSFRVYWSNLLALIDNPIIPLTKHLTYDYTPLNLSLLYTSALEEKRGALWMSLVTFVTSTLVWPKIWPACSALKRCHRGCLITIHYDP